MSHSGRDGDVAVPTIARRPSARPLPLCRGVEVAGSAGSSQAPGAEGGGGGGGERRRERGGEVGGGGGGAGRGGVVRRGGLTCGAAGRGPGSTTIQSGMSTSPPALGFTCAVRTTCRAGDGAGRSAVWLITLIGRAAGAQDPRGDGVGLELPGAAQREPGGHARAGRVEVGIGQGVSDMRERGVGDRLRLRPVHFSLCVLVSP